MQINKNKFLKSKWPLPLVASILFLTASPIIFFGTADAAAPFAQAFVRFDNDNALTNTTGRVCVKTTASDAGTEASVKVTFPTVSSGTDYVVSSTAANWTVNTTGLDTGQTAWPGIGTATAVAGKTVTFPSTALSSNTTYCFNWTNSAALKTSDATSTAPENPASQENIATYTSGAVLLNQSYFAEWVVTNDQVVVSGIVPPSFKFVLSGNTDSFTGSLTPATVVSTTGRTITVTTNAATGYIVWAEDSEGSGGKGALYSATANHYIAGVNGNAPGVASAALNTAQENYGLGATVNTNVSGTLAINAAYDGTGTKAGTLSPSTSNPAYFPIASGTSPANGDIININERANSVATTPEGSDYTDTITFVGAGEF